MIEIIKEFIKKCENNKELTEFFNDLIECWTHRYNAMYYTIPSDENLQIIKDFFAEIYSKDCIEMYSIKKWEPSYGRKEYEIKWFDPPYYND